MATKASKQVPSAKVSAINPKSSSSKLGGGKTTNKTIIY